MPLREKPGGNRTMDHYLQRSWNLNVVSNSTPKILAVMLVLTVGLANSCSVAPEISPLPKKKASASDTLFGFIRTENAEIAIAGATAQYASFKKACSKVRVLKGGMVDYPHRAINLPAHKLDGATRISFARDYFQMDACAWELTGLVIDVSAPPLPHGVAFGIPADLIRPGTTLAYRCSLHQEGPSSCVLEKKVKNTNAGELAKTTFLVYISITRD